MNRNSESERRDGSVLSKTAPHDVRPSVDETQSTRQGATAPQPKIGFDDEDDGISAADLDEAWAGLTAALRSADEDFDAAAAYARLSRSLPSELVALPLVERATVRRPGDSGRELRNLALGLVAMGTVCAGLAGLAFFGPDFERRPATEQEMARRDDATSRPGISSLSAGEEWADGPWEERLLALAEELHAERYRIHDPDRGSLGRPDEDLRRLERDFAHVRDELNRPLDF